MFFKLKRIVCPSHHNFRHTAMYACLNTALDQLTSLFLVCLSPGNYLSEEDARALTAVRIHDFIFQNIAQGEMSLFLLTHSLNR